mgnify:CR=1 FL=1
MPEFDLEQIVELCTRDRAFKELMINDLSYRITEGQKPKDIFSVPQRPKRNFRGDLQDMRRHFNMWYADWFAQYPHIVHKNKVRLVLACLHASFGAKSVKTTVHERTTWVELAEKLQDEATKLGNHESALELAADLIARIDEDGKPYEQIMVAYDQVFTLPETPISERPVRVSCFYHMQILRFGKGVHHAKTSTKLQARIQTS